MAQLARVIRKKDTEFQKLKEEHEELQATDNSNSAAMNDLSASCEAKETELEELKDELKELRDYYKGHEELVKELTARAMKQDKTIKELKAKVKQAEVHIVEQRGEAEAKVKQSDDDLDDIQERLYQKGRYIRELEDKIAMLREELGNWEALNRSLAE